VDRRLVWGLFAAAFVVRAVWVLFVHPPAEAEFSDMARYIDRAELLASEGGEAPRRSLAWQTWGTHTLLALPLWLFGPETGRTVAALWWAAFGAGTVALTAVLAAFVRPPGPHFRALPAIAGTVMFSWYPNLAGTGYWLAETPFAFCQLAAFTALCDVMRRGRAGSALAAGLAGAVAFAVRPQIAVFFALVFVLAMWRRRDLPRVTWRHHVIVALPLLAMFAFSNWRFVHHTGYCCGVAENANMNFTAGRCHNIVTQAFKSEAALASSVRRGSTKDGRRVSIPGFRQLAARGEDHPLALAPALGSETIRFVGYIGEPAIHEDLQAQCWARTGLLEQLRYGVTNMSLLWFWARQWPDSADKKAPAGLRVVSEVYRHLFVVVLWLPGLAGIAWALAGIKRSLPRALCGVNLLVSMGVAAVFFGDVRLRTPYDPFWIVLAAWVVGAGIGRLRDHMASRRGETAAAARESGFSTASSSSTPGADADPH
jgi:hypothetical protein